jgi:hypothetical protein
MGKILIAFIGAKQALTLVEKLPFETTHNLITLFSHD